MTTPPFGSRPCKVCSATGQMYGVMCATCGGTGWRLPEPAQAAPPAPSLVDGDHRHDSYLLMAARALVDDGYIRTFDAVYGQRCSCGTVRNNTRLAATVHSLRHSYGWDIETHVPTGRYLAVYQLRGAGRMPKR